MAIFFLSAESSLPAPPGPLSDKHVHALAYAGLAVLVIRALAGGRWVGVSGVIAVRGAALAVLYGAADEWHQWFVPGRHAELLDLLADATGAAAAALVLWRVARWGRAGRR